MNLVLKTLAGFIVMELAVLPISLAAESGDDYGRSQIGGMNGPIVWESLLHGDGLEGWENRDKGAAWSREGDTIVARARDRNNTGPLFQGNGEWRSYELKVGVTLQNASDVQIRFRRSDEGQYALQFLGGWQCVAISRRDPDGGGKLDVVNFAMENGREYDVVIAVREQSITSYIDGVLINRVTNNTYAGGGIGLGIWGENTTARFRNPRIRHY